MKKILLAILFFTSIINSYAIWPSDVKFTASAKTEGEYTVVTIKIPAGNKNCTFQVKHLSCFDGSTICPGSTYITYYSNGQRYAGKLLGQRGNYKANTSYKAYPNDLTYELCFERIPATITSIGVHLAYEYSNGLTWTPNNSVATWDNVSVRQTFPSVPNTSFISESIIKNHIDNQDDGIVGIYEGTTGSNYKLACVKDQGEYKLIYVDDNAINSPWRIGEIKAVLIPTATIGFFKSNWYMQDKSLNNNCYVTFSGSTMDVLLNGIKEIYIKMYPTASSSNLSGRKQEWSGTGFALNNGYVVTNYHVVEDAKSITISGINGDFNTSYTASVVASDKTNDLAIIRVSDNRFNGFGALPYAIDMNQAEVGNDVFVLGYPLTQTMGDEIKLTNGIISSRTGFQGNVSLYQMSAPIQPGNSGGPMFNSKGNVVGIVCAHHKGTENVGYAIKTSYLKILAETSSISNIFPTYNTVASLPLSGQVKILKKYVFLIKCSNSLNNKNDIISISDNPIESAEKSNQRSIINPSVLNSNWNNIVIDKVEISPQYTNIYLTAYSTSPDYWMSISKDTYIQVYGFKKTIITAEGINYYPQKTFFRGEKKIKLVFPPISTRTEQIDIIEPDSNDGVGWRVYGIKLL